MPCFRDSSRRWSTPTVLLCSVVATGCYNGPFVDFDALGDDTGGSDGGSDEAGLEGSGGGEVGDSTTGTAEGTGGGEGDPRSLPCEIDELLATHCRGCHAATPAAGAPNSLVSYDDLVAASHTEPGRTVAEVAADRIVDATQPMPPGTTPSVPPGQTAAFIAWVTEGVPPGECSGSGEPDPFAGDPICSSGEFWDDGLFDGDQRMNPGRTCIACHTDPSAFGWSDDDDDDIPLFAFAGTMYPTGHEPDDCEGVDGGVDVVVIAANGQSVVVSPNRAGNFFGGSVPPGFTPPYRVKLVAGTAEREMQMDAPHGDCNACHTQDGDSGAPGRIVRP